MAHITFIHGISNKPEAEKLRMLWIQALRLDKLGNNDNLDLPTEGITSEMVYWADILYDKPLADGSLEESTLVGSHDSEDFEAIAGQEPVDPDMAWREEIGGEEKQMVDSLAAKLVFDLLVDDTFTPQVDELDKNLERIPIPWFIKRRIMKQFLRDVHHYLFNYDFSPRAGDNFKVRDIIRDRMIQKLKKGAQEPGPHIIVAHSMGTVIAYDCLTRVPGCPQVDGFMTIGSPLGIDEIQDKLIPDDAEEKRFPKDNAFPSKLQGPWINVYDALDPVTGFDGNIANDFKQNGKELIEVLNEPNWGPWRHNISNYLAGPKLRSALRSLLLLD